MIVIIIWDCVLDKALVRMKIRIKNYYWLEEGAVKSVQTRFREK